MRRTPSSGCYWGFVLCLRDTLYLFLAIAIIAYALRQIKFTQLLYFLYVSREFDSWISEKSTCRSHKTCFFCVKFLVFIYCILLQCVVKYNKGGILHASYYIEI